MFIIVHLWGHSGYLKTVNRMQHDFFWFGMKKDIKAYIKTCEVCQRIKVDTSKSIGLLQPVPIQVKPWLDISMNFISSLPKSHGFEIIFMVVDRLTMLYISGLYLILTLLLKWLWFS